MLFASPPRNETRFVIKNFVNNHTCGQCGNNIEHSRPPQKFIATQLQPVLRVWLDIRPIDV